MSTKRSIRSRVWTAVVAVGLGGTVALAEVADERRVPLTGATIAEAFPGLADDPNVRVWVLQGTALDPYAGEADAAVDDPAPLGFASTNYTTIQGAGFIPNHDGFIIGDAAPWGLYCETGGDRFASAQAELPQGASLRGFRAWTLDNDTGTSSSYVLTSMYEVCQSTASPGTIDVTFLGEILSPDGSDASTGITFSSPVTVDTVNCFYPMLADFGGTAAGCGGQDVALRKVRLAWNRQIAPAPSSPTFNDVPASHLFYQQIEALAASDITGGCGEDNFCPSAPLTRAQMAAFLSKALGLGW